MSTRLFYHKCNDQFARLWLLSIRTRRCNKSFILVYCNLYCRECDITFSKACTLKRHLQSAAVHLKKDALPVKCPACFKPFPCNRAMREHLIRCTRKLRKQQDEIPAKRRKKYPKQQLRGIKVCASYLTFKHEKKFNIFKRTNRFNSETTTHPNSARPQQGQNLQNLLPTPQLAAGVFASKRFRFLALQSGLASQLYDDHARDLFFFYSATDNA